MGQVPYLLVSSAEMAREVTMTHDLVFASRPSLLGMRKFFYGCRDVGFSPYGEFWKRVRKISVLELLGANMVRSFQLIREEEVSSMIDKIGQSCSMATPVNLGMLLLTLTNNVICRAALGKRYEGGFTKLTREIVTLLGAFCVGDYYPWLRWVDILTGVDAKMESTAKEMNSFLDQVIEDHLVRKRDDNGSSHKDFVDILLQVQKDCVVDVPLTRDDIKAIALVLS
ncbi:hypothetical protein HHK36_024333 [Tetracentron sinense]|uniref:Uncharacterized protein n=1 Tax=Tetracentron sinense TaxID=13715 RepID=A0A834YJ83_TETSI|nr:hypothetical protein HHK36_024333 [Tetracentron sinense]